MPDDKKDNVTPFRKIKKQIENSGAPSSEPIFNLPVATQNLAILLIGLHVASLLLSSSMHHLTFYSLAFVPARYTGEIPFDIFAIISPITHMLLHSGWMHMLMNVGMLLAFGSLVEKTFGGRRMIQLVLASGVVGALTHLVFYHDSVYPMLGASGAISGLFAAMIILMNRQTGDKRRLMLLVAIWIGISLFFGVVGAPGIEGNIAWTTHIGGFFAGLALTAHWLQNKF